MHRSSIHAFLPAQACSQYMLWSGMHAWHAYVPVCVSHPLHRVDAQVRHACVPACESHPLHRVGAHPLRGTGVRQCSLP